MTYADLTPEERNRIVNSPELMGKLQEDYDRGMQQLADAFSESMRKLVEREDAEREKTG